MLKNIKIIFSILLILLSISPFSVLADEIAENQNKNYFIVTAYYSPLTDQKNYLTWNYEDEIRLNWNWTHWASWKQVFSWMFAWPKNYSFWTKIYLEWVWVWAIEDRWWAIVNSWERWYEYDRIDIWVWYWDEWLKRALYWGKRKVKWNIVSINSKITIDINKFYSPNWTTKKLSQVPEIFNVWIWKESDEEIVKDLKTFLNNVWLYKSEITWDYDENLIKFITKYQIENNIIKEITDSWAWYWWNLTRKNILRKYLDWDIKEIKKINSNQNVSKQQETKKSDIFISNPKTKEQIKALQQAFNDLEYYNWNLDWSSENIKKLILDYQLKQNLVKNSSDIWAWYFWPKTRESLKKEYNIFLENSKKEQEFQQKIDELNILSKQKATEKIEKIWVPEFSEISSRVRELQLTLSKVGYFDYKDTAIFWETTKKSLINYQLDKNIISSIKDIWAWLFWPKTREKLKDDLRKIFFDEVVKSEKLEEKMDKVLFQKLIKRV